MKGYRDNGGAAGGFGARNKTVYDDVFGGPPKFGATTLPPRVEDYTEIFQGFHASRGSSIPVLDLPPPYNDSDDVWFDVQSSKLDYSEVFGGFNGLDFAVSYEELFNSSKVEDGDSSDEVWTPAQSESLSDELDPYTSLETNQHVSTSDPVDLFGIKLQNELNLKAEKQLLNGITNDSEFLDVSNKTESEKLFSLANNNHFERKQLKKSFSQPLDRSHLSVSDLSLKTQPSNLPPPSRPPPVLSSKKGDIDFFDSKLKTSKSYGFEKMKGDRSPPYFDVEIDASSSAAADAAAMKDAVEQAQAKLKSAKDKMDRKKEGFQNRSKSNVGDKKEKVNEDERSNGFGNNKEKISLESFEQKQDFKNVLERQETVDVFHKGHEPLKEHTLGQNSCEPKEAEKTVLVEEIKTPSEVDESELYDNLIEIQLKNNDIEPEVKLVRDNENERTLWDDYGEAFEKEHEKELKESEEKDAKDVQQSGPPEIVIITQIEEDDDEHESEEHESMLENPFHCEVNESDNISEMVFEEDENKKEQTLDHNEKILEEEFKQDEDEIKEDEGLEQTPNDDMANEDIETIHETNCNSEEDSEIQKDHESEEEIEQKEEVVSENDDESSTVDDNENSQDSVNIQHDITSEKDEFTPQIPIYPINPQKTETNNITSKKDEFTSQIPIYPTNPEKTETNNITSEKDEFTPRIPIYPTNPEKTETTPQPPSSSNSKQSNFEGVEIEVRKTNGVNEETKMENEKKRMERERLEKVREMEKERLRKMEEERERQIEREKDRMAVDRATLEARERAFSETKERTERAAVERATAEYRQRALAEARERLEKACAEARERSLADKAMEGRLRVEKATAEARERAERSVDDKFSGGSRSVGGLRYGQNSAAYNGESESPQRCKARLERHQRTADRAAKALAEKNMRDLLAQKEQAERNRLAESLDAEVKRWCSGKQGNLRALLSTLQYILGSDSGWQPIPLTEVITTAAVKKAYRKATLCVHPDKLQQRGATIQQKYICEKVFDLLKEAWNKFNSEER